MKNMFSPFKSRESIRMADFGFLMTIATKTEPCTEEVYAHELETYLRKSRRNDLSPRYNDVSKALDVLLGKYGWEFVYELPHAIVQAVAIGGIAIGTTTRSLSRKVTHREPVLNGGGTLQERVTSAAKRNQPILHLLKNKRISGRLQDILQFHRQLASRYEHSRE